MSFWASATRLTGKHWAAPYAYSLLTASWPRASRGVGALAPAPAASTRPRHVSAVGLLGLVTRAAFWLCLPASVTLVFFAVRLVTVVSKRTSPPIHRFIAAHSITALCQAFNYHFAMKAGCTRHSTIHGVCYGWASGSFQVDSLLMPHRQLISPRAASTAAASVACIVSRLPPREVSINLGHDDPIGPRIILSSSPRLLQARHISSGRSTLFAPGLRPQGALRAGLVARGAPQLPGMPAPQTMDHLPRS
jgi:hypothetical protein